MAKRDKLTKVVADLEAQLKELESSLEGSELEVAKEREAKKELMEELLIYKKETMEKWVSKGCQAG